MGRTHVDYGIDLGTTNSCLAVFEGGEARVLKNKKHQDSLPSAVYYDEQGACLVGAGAKSRLHVDPENAASEFKLQIGSDWKKYFPNRRKRYAEAECWRTPEQLSAEVLKSLKGNFLGSGGEEVSAAVITVPAAFGTTRSAATKEAARLAGIRYSPILQEPIAAALAYGFTRARCKTFWLVYDFGGGTFDAAVIKTFEGIPQVINHGGNNHLGGKLIDWDIVDELLIPEVRRQSGWDDFGRDNPNWNGAVARLKEGAEEGKINLSDEDESSYVFDFKLKGGDGRSCVFEYELRGEQIEPLVEPYVRQSVGICRRVLAEANLRPGDIEKVLLVGGPTLMSYVRRRLEDPEGGLNITLEHGINPMTVVAQGAAIFAANEPCPLDEDEDSKRKPRHGYKLNLRYEQISSEEKPEVNGQVVPPDGAPGLSGYEIQFANDEGGAPWSSNKITLRPEGRFTAELSAPTKGQTYIYQIKLMTAQGDKVEVEPDTCSYTRTEGFEPGTVTPTLTNSIGVALASNEVMWFFKKGTRLPCEKSSLDNLRWVHHFRSEQAGASLNIPIVEGENQKADRNQIVCELMVPTGSLKRDIRAGEDVEIAIKIDKSQVLTIELYTAALRKEKIETVLKKGSALPTAEQLDRHTRQIKARLEKVKDSVLETGDPKSLLILNTLDKDSTLQEIDKQQNAAATDAGARGKLEQMLRELKARIDEVEDANEIPAAELEADKVSAWAQEVVKHYGNEVDRQNFQIRQRELLAARRAHNTSPQELRRKTELMNSFAFEIYGKTSENWIGMFQDLENRDINDFTDSKLAVELLTQGRTAVSANEFERLRTAVRQLWQLLERSPEINRPPIDWSNY